MLMATLIGEAVTYAGGAKHSGVTIVYLVTIMAIAWWGGYGPGIVGCLLGLFAAPFVFTSNFNPGKVDLGRAVLVLIVSALISRVAEGRRKAEEALREANEQLDARVRERTEELQQSNAELRRVNEALNEFSYSASHDLQQPLRMITLYTQLLERKYRGRLDADADEYLEAIVSGGRQMKTLLSDLLAYSKSAHTSTEEIGMVDANLVAKNVLTNLKSALEESGGTVEVAPLPCLRMHEFHLTELLQNLFSNAIKYRSDEPPRIHVGAEFDGAFWTFSVADNGIGIAPQHAKQIFGLFKRLHSSESYEGTGVGLAICERIVGRYNGSIWVEPRTPRGSIFRFKLKAGEETPDVAANLPNQHATSQGALGT